MSTTIQVGAFVGLEAARAACKLAGDDVDRDGLLIDLINRASGLFERFTGRKLYRRTYAGARVDGSGEAVLYLPEYPVLSITSLKADVDRAFAAASELIVFDGTGSQATHDVVCDFPSGEMTMVTGSWPEGPQTVLVTYEAGYDADTAKDLVQAQALQVSAWWFELGRDPKITAQSMAGVSVELHSPIFRLGDIVDEVKSVLLAYRRPAFAA